jgi:propanol-preferring alcohol dehydrogenase
MRAMVLYAANTRLQLKDLPEPKVGPDEILLRTHACAVCSTDLHVVDGELPHPKLPLIPGHEIIGSALAMGSAFASLSVAIAVGHDWRWPQIA